MMVWIRWATGAAAVIGLILAAVAAKVEPKKVEDDDESVSNAAV